MRVEPFTTGDFLHVYNRGNRKSEIVRDERDKWRFMQALYFFNDARSSQNVLRNIERVKLSKSDFDRNRDPLVKIICYSLLPNHFHLVLKEFKEGGISKFMQKLGTGYTNFFNLKHQETGRLFQGSYKGKVIKKQSYLDYLSVYIQVINILELFPGGLKNALDDLDKGFNFVENYPFSSYLDFVGKNESLIVDRIAIKEVFSRPGEDYGKFAREIVETRKFEVLDDLKLD